MGNCFYILLLVKVKIAPKWRLFGYFNTRFPYATHKGFLFYQTCPLNLNLKNFFSNKYIIIFFGHSNIPEDDTHWNIGMNKKIMNYSDKSPQFITHNYKGIFPCFLLGIGATLFSSILKPFINLVLVSDGIITSSIKPLAAAP